MSDWDDVQRELNTGSNYYKPHKLEVGQPEEIVVTRYAKWTETKYPIKNKDGSSLGYTWRFFLQDGRIWDVSNANRKELMRGLHPTGKEDQVVAGRFEVTNVGRVIDKRPAVQVKYLGPASQDVSEPEEVI